VFLTTTIYQKKGHQESVLLARWRIYLGKSQQIRVGALWLRNTPQRRGQVPRGPNGELLPQRDMQISLFGMIYSDFCHF